MLLLLLLLTAIAARAEVHEHPGSKEPLAHEKYIRAVSEAESPVEPLYIKTNGLLAPPP